MALLPSSNSHNLILQYTRSPYTFSSIKMQSVAINSTGFRSTYELIFHNFISTFEQLFSGQNDHSAITALLKRVSGYRGIEFQLPLAIKIFDSVKQCKDPEFYNALLYIIKKNHHKDLFVLAHDVFLKAKENNAQSRWAITHYLTIGIQASEFQFLYPIIKNLLEENSHLIPLFMVHNFIEKGEGFLTTEQTSYLKELSFGRSSETDNRLKPNKKIF